MKLNHNLTLHLSDTLVSDVFISNYINRLSGHAIRCYLILLQTFQHGNRKINVTEIAQRLDSNESEIQKALSELQQLQLIVIQSGHLDIADLKFLEIKRHYNDNTFNQDSEKEDEKTVSQRETIVKQINDTFFQGVMGLGFYTKIDEWFHKYQFEPEVVYAIFSEAAGNGKLANTGYVNGIADNWGRAGIKNYQQLNQYYKEFEKRKEIIFKIKQKLNIKSNFTSYQETLVNKWINEFQFDFPIIELALKETININSPNLKYIDKILEDWHQNNLQTVDEIKQYKREYQEQKKKKSHSSSKSSKTKKFKSDAQAKLDVPEEDLYNIDLIQYYAEQEDE